MMRSLVWKRYRHQRADPLLDDTEAGHETRRPAGTLRTSTDVFIVEHAVADGAADAKSFARAARMIRRSLFERHEYAALGPHGFDREIQDKAKEFVQRAVSGKLTAGSNQRAHLDRARGHGLLLGVLARQHAFQAGDDRGSGDFRFVLKHHNAGRLAALNGIVEDHREVPGRDPIARPQPQFAAEPDPVDQGAVLAVQILDRPVASFALQHQVLARRTRVVGETERARAASAQCGPRRLRALRFWSFRRGCG